MLNSKSLQLGRVVLSRILTATRIPLSTSVSACSSSRESSVDRASNSSSPRQRACPESYQRARRGPFTQPMPQLHNPFVEDPFLRTCLSNMLPPQVRHCHVATQSHVFSVSHLIMRCGILATFKVWHDNLHYIVNWCRYQRMFSVILSDLAKDCAMRSTVSDDRLNWNCPI